MTNKEILERLRQVRDSQSAVVGHITMAAHTLVDNLIFDLAALESEPEPLAVGYTRPDIALRLKRGFSVMVSPESYGTGTEPVTIHARKP